MTVRFFALDDIENIFLFCGDLFKHPKSPERYLLVFLVEKTLLMVYNVSAKIVASNVGSNFFCIIIQKKFRNPYETVSHWQDDDSVKPTFMGWPTYYYTTLELLIGANCSDVLMHVDTVYWFHVGKILLSRLLSSLVISVWIKYSQVIYQTQPCQSFMN